MKKKRHAKIKEIITEKSIETQEELLLCLKNEGFDVTQATVSRDIKELRLIKALDSNQSYRYMSPHAEVGELEMNYKQIFKSTVISVDCACNIVVVKCHNGMAHGACAAIDSMQWVMVMGSIAGDDTIFLLSRTESEARALVVELKRILNEN